MKKFITKSVIGLSLLGAGVVMATVVPSGNVVYAEEVSTTNVSVSLDDSWLGDAGWWWEEDGKNHIFNTGIQLNGRMAGRWGGTDGYEVYLPSYFATTFTYETWDRGAQSFVRKTGNFGTPFLVEDIAVDANGDGEYDANGVDDPYVISDSKLITINDNRQYHNTISSEEVTLSVDKKNGGTVTNATGDVTIKFEWSGYYDESINRYIFNVYTNGYRTGDFYTEYNGVSQFGPASKQTYYAKTASGYRLVTVYVTDGSKKTEPTPIPNTPSLDVKEVTDQTFLTTVQQLFAGLKVKLFDISLLKDGVAVQPDGSIEVSVPIPAGFDKSKLAIYYVSDDGKTKEKLAGKVVGDNYVFTTTHFSYYALVEEATATTANQVATPAGTAKTAKTAKSPVRQTSANSLFPTLSVAIALIGTAGVVIRKKLMVK